MWWPCPLAGNKFASRNALAASPTAVQPFLLFPSLETLTINCIAQTVVDSKDIFIKLWKTMERETNIELLRAATGVFTQVIAAHSRILISFLIK